MNKIDKIRYRALKFLSSFSPEGAIDFRKKNPEKYKKYVSDELEETLSKFEYLTFSCNAVRVVSQLGLQQLRDLEDIRRKDLTLMVSVIAIVLSLVALGISIASFLNSMPRVASI